VKIFVCKTVERKFYRGRFLLRVAFVENNKLRLHKSVGGRTREGTLIGLLAEKRKSYNTTLRMNIRDERMT